MIYLKKSVSFYKMDDSVLKQKYIEPTRPYSQNEHQYNREKMFNKLRIGKTWVFHKKCGHFYRVKKNGKKQQEIENSYTDDLGNCSVCWRINRTSRNLKSAAIDVVREYSIYFCNTNKFFTYDMVKLENKFYNWLYL